MSNSKKQELLEEALSPDDIHLNFAEKDDGDVSKKFRAVSFLQSDIKVKEDSINDRS